MKFKELALTGAYLIELEPNVDQRGYFARTFCVKEFENYSLVSKFVQCSTSHNLKKGIIRGIHFQAEPWQETKLVRCTRGSIFDVIVDLRINSATYMQWYGTELSMDNQKMIYVPKGFGHGYQTLEDNSDVYYMIDEYYSLEAARTIEYKVIPNLQYPL